MRNRWYSESSKRIPEIKNMVKKYFNKNPSTNNSSLWSNTYCASYQVISFEDILDEG